jgi:endonuclease YncB( thermonuclease family)
MRTLSFGVGGAFALALLGAFTLSDSPIMGTARAVDGDTIAIGQQRIRIWGIDAPESAQTCQREGREWDCGHAATIIMTKILDRGPVSCVQKDTDRYKRIVAQCFSGSADIGGLMVRGGWAVDYTHYSGGYYTEAQRAASNERLGIHAGTFENPADWRHSHKK